MSAITESDGQVVYKIKDIFGNAYYKNAIGLYHRKDGPAIEKDHGNTQCWYLNGHRHRSGGPAIEWENGAKEWYINDQRHRADGPAVIPSDGSPCSWYYEGLEYSEEKFKLKFMKNPEENTPVKTTTKYETVYKLNGLKHRLDGPAVEIMEGSKEYWVNGKLHRTDGPAIESSNGNKEWYLNDKRHRADGPAMEFANNHKEWYLNGQLHRIGGPAVETNNSSTWYVNGKLHREDGPAIEYHNGFKEYYLNGARISESQFFENSKKHVSRVVGDYYVKYVDALGRLHRVDGPAFENNSGGKEWHLNGQLHRVGGPAIEFITGEKRYLQYGKLHRIDGPAVEYSNGDKLWYKHDKLHNEAGPAVIKFNGDKEYWISGNKLTLEQFTNHSNSTKNYNGDILWHNNKGLLHRMLGPAVENRNGAKYWVQHGKKHRLDGPAIEHANGSKEWWVNGKKHRTDGPAIIRANGMKLWFINGVEKTEAQFNEEIKAQNSLIETAKKIIGGKPLDIIGTSHVNGTTVHTKNGMYHRVGGPAIEYNSGAKEWFLNDKRHREDGPAIESPSGEKQWFLNAVRHRVDGPAIEYAEGEKQWYVHGKLHREDGPAVERTDGYKEWWLHNVKMSEEEFKVAVSLMKKSYIGNDLNQNDFALLSKEIQKIFEEAKLTVSIVTINSKGDKIHKNEKGYLHRLVGPAVDGKNGNKEWWVNGKRHRLDGPAVEHNDGYKEWFINGQRQRTDGPAIEHPGGGKEWWVNGVPHRTDGPAVEHKTASFHQEAWYINGKLHREDGPAIIENGQKYYYLNNKSLTEQEFKKQTKQIIENKKMLSLEEIKQLKLGAKVKIKIGNEIREATIVENSGNSHTFSFADKYVGPYGQSWVPVAGNIAHENAKNLDIKHANNCWISTHESGIIESVISNPKHDLNSAHLSKDILDKLVPGDKVQLFHRPGMGSLFSNKLLTATVVANEVDLTLHFDANNKPAGTHRSISYEASKHAKELGFNVGANDYWNVRKTSTEWGKIVEVITPSKEKDLSKLSESLNEVKKAVEELKAYAVVKEASPTHVIPTITISKNELEEIDAKFIQKFTEAISKELEKHYTQPIDKKEVINHMKTAIPTDGNVMDAVKKIDLKEAEYMKTNPAIFLKSPTFKDTFKSDLRDAGYRVASTQLTKAAKAALLACFKTDGVTNSKLEVIKELLETEFGSAFISAIIGYAITYSPNKFSKDPRVAKLAEEFRINSMTIAGNEIVSSVIKNVIPALLAEPKTRILVEEKKKAEELELEEELVWDESQSQSA